MTGAGTPILVPVLPNHRFNEDALRRYLTDKVPGFEQSCTVRQFQGGLSNPTFHVQAGQHAYVLRKKPPGKLLPSAHAVDREFRVQRALAGSGVPVPKMYLLCEDESIMGQMFYVMEHVEGRIFTDRLLSECERDERAAIYREMNQVLARLHRIDHRAVGLESFGRGENYARRQVERWSKQYAASASEDLPEMKQLSGWLNEHVPDRDEITIVHGDYRLGNLVFHPTQSKVLAVLDWELATIGHPLSDLAYCCLPWHLPRATERGFADVDIEALGIPTEAAYLAEYCRATERADVPNWNFFVIFSMFRIAAILAGAYRRALDGNASDAQTTTRVGAVYKEIAKHAWAQAQSRSR